LRDGCLTRMPSRERKNEQCDEHDWGFFIFSSTSLLEWKLEAFIPQPTDARVFLHEGNIATRDNDDELKIVMRTANYDETNLTTNPPRAYSSIGTDGGHTWSVTMPEPELHNAKSKDSLVVLPMELTFILES